MFKKLHRQMTIFASLITSGILILMAVSCLVISERGLTHNTYERFLNNGNSCVAYLEIRLCFLTSGYWKQSRNTKWNFAFGITEKAVF